MRRTLNKSLFTNTRAEFLSEIQLLTLGLILNPFLPICYLSDTPKNRLHFLDEHSSNGSSTNPQESFEKILKISVCPEVTLD